MGTPGTSYGGFLTTRALIDPHPALKAASPQATCADLFIGDDWHHNGACRLDYAFMSYDNYERFLALGPLSNVDSKIFYG